jgi:imidazole glycerol-phosphate synthase subunit HisF
MLKLRVIPTLLIREVNLVKGPAFDSWRAVGSPMQAVKVFNRRDVDELIILDINATPTGTEPDYEQIAVLAQECFVPLTVGGGVVSLDCIRKLLHAGADKVAVNTRAYGEPRFITEAANRFGSQCIVAAIDYRQHSDGRLECFSHCGKVSTGHDPLEWSVELERLGAGEILLTSIERDGVMQGYDLETIRSVAAAVTIPVIASGGAGNYDHMRAAIQEAGASAVAASSMFHFTQQTPAEAKRSLAMAGIPVRSRLGTAQAKK